MSFRVEEVLMYQVRAGRTLRGNKFKHVDIIVPLSSLPVGREVSAQPVMCHKPEIIIGGINRVFEIFRLNP